MKRSLPLLLMLLAASMGACGHEPQSGTAPAATAAQAAAPASAAAPDPAALLAKAQTPQPPPVAAAAADGSAAAQGSAADAANDLPVGTTSLERVADLPPQQQLPDGRWKPGVNYDPVVPAQPTNVAPGKVEVLEVFWYACPHCYALEPYLVAWRKTKPSYIQFVRVPVMWGPVHRAHAQLYYTLEQLGRNDLDGKVFETLHQNQNPLVGNTPDETFQLQLRFAKENGIDPDAFRKAYNSFAVNADLQHADDITQRYHVEGVPFIAINGKYATDVGKAGSHENLIALINDLAAAEHRRH